MYPTIEEEIEAWDRYQRLYRESHRESARAYQAKLRKDNPKYVKQQQRIYRQEHREELRIKAQKYRDMKSKARGK